MKLANQWSKGLVYYTFDLRSKNFDWTKRVVEGALPISGHLFAMMDKPFEDI